MSSAIDPKHILNAEKAKALSLEKQDVESFLKDWRFAVRDNRRLVAKALRASNFLSDIAGALTKNCGHGLVFRHLMAHPVSQDQFKLLCPSWSKTAENKGKPLAIAAAQAAATVIQSRLDRGLVRWLTPTTNRPSLQNLRAVLSVVPALMAQQKVATARRTRLAYEQERAVIDLLKTNGWTLLPSKLVDVNAAVPSKHFMHKTRFATRTRRQEMDIACGLKGTYVLAMECKVTNDETNSVKRINDVVKKANAWEKHWGSFVRTAALLEGVVAPKDVQRLTDANVEVFWSHDLDALRAWLAEQV